MSGDWVSIGRFSDPYGVKGEIRLKFFTQSPDGIKAYKQLFLGPDYAPLRITTGRRVKDGILARVEGFETPEAAKSLKGKEVFIKREDLLPLDEGEFYHADLVGLQASTKDGKILGGVTAVHDFGAGPIIEIALDAPIKGIGNSLMLPFRDEVVLDVDIKSGRITVDADGWLGEEEKT